MRRQGMTLRQQWLLVTAILATLVGGLAAGAYLLRDELFPVEVGSSAPPFRARRVDGSNQVRSLADYRGKVVVLNVWATWCAPCVIEMPTFQRLREKIPDTSLAVIAVSIDDYVGADSVRNFARNLGLTFDVLLDSTHTIDRVYQVTGYPETFVIARDGTIRMKWIGPADWASDNSATSRDSIEQMLREAERSPLRRINAVPLIRKLLAQ